MGAEAGAHWAGFEASEPVLVLVESQNEEQSRGYLPRPQAAQGSACPGVGCWGAWGCVGACAAAAPVQCHWPCWARVAAVVGGWAPAGVEGCWKGAGGRRWMAAQEARGSGWWAWATDWGGAGMLLGSSGCWAGPEVGFLVWGALALVF